MLNRQFVSIQIISLGIFFKAASKRASCLGKALQVIEVSASTFQCAIARTLYCQSILMYQ